MSKSQPAQPVAPPRTDHVSTPIVVHETGERRPTPKNPWWRDARRRRLLAGADLITGLLVTAAAIILGASLELLALAPAWVLLGKLLGLYDADHRAIRHLTEDELPAIAGLASLGTGLLIVVESLGASSGIEPRTAAILWSGAFITAVLLRGGIRHIWRLCTSQERTAVIGEPELVAAFKKKIELFPDMHLSLAEMNPVFATGHEVPTRSMLDRIDRLILASSAPEPAVVQLLAAQCRAARTKLSVVCALSGTARPGRQLSQVVELPILEYRTWDVSRSTMFFKRAFDLLVATSALVTLSPLLVAIGATVKLDGRGPVFYRQTRLGRNARPFSMLKFRSMVNGADCPGSDLDNEITIAMFKPENDSRVTRVGRLLRRFSLDELPQLINVVRGEMSIVGPRPEKPTVVERYRDEFLPRLSVRPGITGPMQVFGRGRLSFPERAALEVDYVENLSFARDLHILAMTVPAVLRGTGAY